MREIKFRGVYRNGKSIVKLVPVGSLTLFTDGTYHVNDELPVSELEQFTGLKDKNGKEIYEGDIIRFETPDFENPGVEDYGKQWTSAVEYVDDEFTFSGAYADPESKVDWDTVEIIGNIHENPELLT